MCPIIIIGCLDRVPGTPGTVTALVTEPESVDGESPGSPKRDVSVP